MRMLPLKVLKKGIERLRQREIDCAVAIIESVIEPLHYPVRGVSGEKYYELEDAIIKVLTKYY